MIFETLGPIDYHESGTGPTVVLVPGIVQHRLGVPTLVVWGEASHPAVGRANDLLSRCIPGADRATIAGAAHFMIATHPKPFADLVSRHVGESSLELAAAAR